MIGKTFFLPIKTYKAAGLSSLTALSLLVLLSSCSNNKTSQNKPSEVQATKSLTPANQQVAAIPMDTSLMYLKKFADAYPRDVHLLNQPKLQQELKTLLQNHYGNFRKFWQTETPIEIEENVLSTSGCEEHNCAANLYVLQIDLAHNIINVYHFGTEGVESYLKDGRKIKLPSKMAKEFLKINSNNTQ